VKRLGVLISGRGSNFEAIADQIDAGALEAEIALVISKRAVSRPSVFPRRASTAKFTTVFCSTN
jgi:folate-dependent phosphoribosylglycinamide formyltransferase PurN